MGVRLAIAAALMLAAGAAAAQGGTAPRGPFDGAWAIDAQTAAGPCGSGFAGEYSIAAGLISGRFIAVGTTREVRGTVSPDGALLMRIGGADGIILTGRLQGRVGWGEWQSPECSGRFVTNRF